ncbi:MAG: type II toxin-antitoxin system VapC family toxin [Deltaproteobacteria bacterium]|nr:type II toxin-antitoxin system VapC family toxin [Deltaproteobacteria bacterium]
MKYLVDTNILIYLLNSKSLQLERKFTRRDSRQFGVSSITVAELIYGARKSRRVERNTNAVIKMLSSFELLDFTSADAFEYGDIRADLESKGKVIGGNDLLIAAQARHLGLIVLTANTDEFSRVSGLKIEDWTK